ncbi:MAG: type III-B CRISPR module RAMP protein Cmr1 [Bacillota bacterium]
MGKPQLTLRLRLLTPAFLAGADQGVAELRAPSIKGLLRFWWRATQASNSRMAEQEKSIFGSAGDEVKGGCSAFTLQISPSRPANAISKSPFPKNGDTQYQVKGHSLNILEYLAYGTYTYQKSEHCNVFDRSYIKSGQVFTLIIRLVRNDALNAVVQALSAFYAFGGIGARSRNGFGSMVLETVDGDSSLEKLIQSTPPGVFKSFANGKHLPDFTAFSGQTRLFRTRTHHQTWDSCLAELGHAYRAARLSIESKHHYSVRQFIGAPLIVDKRQKSLLSRHAKPYFLRIHKDSNGYVGYILYLPSQYYPKKIEDTSGRELTPEQMTSRFLHACDAINTALSKSLEAIR